MQTAKIFNNGRSQAVRLPKNCQLQGSDVYIRKLEGMVVLIPKKSPWASLMRSLEMFSDDFMSDRNQPARQKRSRLS